MAPVLIVLLARNLIESLDVPAFLTGADGELLFFNEAAGEMIGRRFEEVGRQPLHRWAVLSPVDGDGNALPSHRLPLSVALRDGVPAFGRFCVHTDDDRLVEVQSSAIPLRDEQAARGAVVLFWPARSDSADGETA